MSDDFKTGISTATRWVFTGTPDNYESIMLNAGDKIPKSAKPRPWLLGEPSKPKTPPKKPAAKKKTTGKK
jgi:hypothetical protein